MTKVVQANTPGGMKPGLLPHPERTRRLIRWLNAIGAGAITMQELSTPSRIVWRLRRRWFLVTATPNNTGLRGLGRVGNGAAFRRGVWTLIRKSELVLPWLIPLHILIALVKHHELGPVAVYSIHLPAGEANAHARVAHIDLIASDAEARNTPVMLNGDFNDKRVRQLLEQRNTGWVVRGSGVDWQAVRGLRFTDWDQTWALTGKVTDHPVLVGTVTKPR